MKVLRAYLGCLLVLFMAALPALSAVSAQNVPGTALKMSSAVSDVTFVIFDTETTGFSPAKDNIVEIGAVMVRNGEIIAEKSWLINPGRAIPRRAAQVHGITDAMVKGKPTFAEVYPEFLEFIGEHILFAHNARFDVDMVRGEVERAGLAMPQNVVIDTLKLFRTWYPEAPSHKLSVLADLIGITEEGFHRGEADSRFTAMIFFEGLTRHPKCTTLRRLFASAGGMIVF